MNGFVFNLLVIILILLVTIFSVSAVLISAVMILHHLLAAAVFLTAGMLGLAYILTVACRPDWPEYK